MKSYFCKILIYERFISIVLVLVLNVDISIITFKRSYVFAIYYYYSTEYV